MRWPFAREGMPFILSTAIPALVLLDAAVMFSGAVLWILASVIGVLALAVLAFFRDPNRRGPRGSDLVVAPADGKVIEISPADEPFVAGGALRLSIFLSLFDVHVNRYPVSGNIELRSYEPGRFEPAWRQSASRNNERASTGIDCGGRPILVNQIAGLAAKRIVTYAEVGDRVQQGDRMGLIRFGSRVDVYMPKDAQVSVKVGDRAIGGVTVLAQLCAQVETRT